jgi:hypothetical protein
MLSEVELQKEIRALHERKAIAVDVMRETKRHQRLA